MSHLDAKQRTEGKGRETIRILRYCLTDWSWCRPEARGNSRDAEKRWGEGEGKRNQASVHLGSTWVRILGKEIWEFCRGPGHLAASVRSYIKILIVTNTKMERAAKGFLHGEPGEEKLIDGEVLSVFRPKPVIDRFSMKALSL